MDAFKLVDELKGHAPVFESGIYVGRAKYCLRILRREICETAGLGKLFSTHFDLVVDPGATRLKSLARYTLHTPRGKIDFYRLGSEVIPMGGLYD